MSKKKRYKPKSGKYSAGKVKSQKRPHKTVKTKAQKGREDYPHFRYYIKADHPALLTGELSEDEYKFRKVTHSERDGGRLNEKVYPNPNPKDPNPMYIGKRVRHDKKMHFGKRYQWKYPKK